MEDPTRPVLSGPPPPPFPAVVPPQPSVVSPFTTLGLALHPVPAPVSAPLPDLNRNLALVPEPTPPQDPAASTSSKHLMWKNRLQEYTQRSSLQLPKYQTFNEGAAHVPRFRSTVWVDGAQYTSPNSFLHRKSAEQDVAKLAFESIMERVKDDEGCLLVREDTVFCKSILNEFAVKVNLPMPTYNIVQLPGLLPVFLSTIVFDGVSYTGETGKNKKEAEQLAARAAILSLLDNPGSSKSLYEIIKSKRKLYAAMYRIKDPSHSQPNIVPVGVKVGHSETTVSQQQDVNTAIIRDAVPAITLSPAASPAASGMHPPHHEFKRSRPDPTPELIPLPIAFVQPVSEHPLGINVGSSSAKKRRKNKKKANKNDQSDAQFPIDAIPFNQASPCSVAQ